VGCGLSHVLLQIDAEHDYSACDVDARVVAACRTRFTDRRAAFAACDIYALPYPDQAFDLVFSTEVVEHVLEPERWAAELARVVAPGGWLQLSTPNYGDWPLPFIEKTFLEWMARRQGFTRKGLHPTPFDRQRLVRLLEGVGLDDVHIRNTPCWLALVGWGRKPE
jgi:SAM-dependent methyltransferase